MIGAREVTTPRKMKEWKITDEKGTILFGSKIPSRMGATWCRPSLVRGIFRLCGSLGILRHLYVSSPFLFGRREK